MNSDTSTAEALAWAEFWESVAVGIAALSNQSPQALDQEDRVA